MARLVAEAEIAAWTLIEQRRVHLEASAGPVADDARLGVTEGENPR